MEKWIEVKCEFCGETIFVFYRGEKPCEKDIEAAKKKHLCQRDSRDEHAIDYER